ncbi:MAG: beta strand repeat-containing protein, partial [Flavobacterium sp.]
MAKHYSNATALPRRGLWLFILSLFFVFPFSYAQTVLISPTGAGGFENGNTFVDNGWTTVNPSTDQWRVGNTTALTAFAGTNCAFVSTNSTTWAYSQTSVFNHLYRDVTIPAGETAVTLSFRWRVGGEGTTTSDWDNLKIFIGPTSNTPTSTSAVSGTGVTQLIGPNAVSGMYKLSSASWNSETISFSAAPGTYRLFFQWKSDSADIVNPPAAIDNISLTSAAPAQYTWIATTGTAAWNTAGSWSPSRTIPFATDVLNFSNGGNSIVTVPSGAVGGNVVFAGNTSANFQASATNTLTLSSLDIPSGNNLFLNGTDAFAQTLAFSAGAVNTIGGRLEVVNTSGANRLNFTNSVTTVGSTGFLAAGSTVTTAVFTSTATNLLINGTYEHKYTTAAGTIPTATWNAASNCNIVGYTSNTNAPGGIAQTFGNFTWNCTSQTGNLSLTSSSTTGVVGTFRITSTGTGQCRWTATGGYTVNANNFTQTGGIFDLSTGASGNGMSFNVSGTFSQTGGTFRSTGTSTNNPTLHFNGTVAQTVGFATQPTGPITYRISNPNGIVLTGPSANFTIGNATLGSLRISTNSANPITFGGSTNALSYDATNTTLTYDFAGNTTARAIEFPATNGPASLTVAVGAGNVLTVPFSRTVRNTLTMTSGDIDISSNALTLGTAATNATTAGTLTWTSGNIRTTSGSFTRWFTTSGLPTSAGTGVGFFPLASGLNNRNVSLFFTTSTALSTGGTITASHSNIGGLETITPFTDA